MKTVYALVDCDSFFCNCERLFREDLRHCPVIVLSNNDGCVVSRSKEAKALRIPMGAPYFKIKEFCYKNKVAVFSSNFSLYIDISERVLNTLRKLAPEIEAYSVDEAFLNLSEIKNQHSFCLEVKNKIWKNIGVPVSIGIGPTKQLSKVACYFAKRVKEYQGVTDLCDPLKQNELLSQMPVEDLWGVGGASAKKLQMFGIKNALDFRDYHNAALLRSQLTILGEKIQNELKGIICFPLTTNRTKKKSIMSSRSFGQVVYDKKSLAESLADHASEVAYELRAQKSVCQGISIYIRSSLFKENGLSYDKSASFSFETPTSNTFKIIEAAISLLDCIYRDGVEYKKSGVIAFDLFDEDHHHLGLFSNPDSELQKTLMKTMDFINSKDGPHTLHSMALGINNQQWKMNRHYKSPRFTTSWQELPKFYS